MAFELSNISTAKTGLDFIVWVKTPFPGNYAPNDTPCIYIQIDQRLIPVSIEDTPRVLDNVGVPVWSDRQFDEITQWIIANKAILHYLYHSSPRPAANRN